MIALYIVSANHPPGLQGKVKTKVEPTAHRLTDRQYRLQKQCYVLERLRTFDKDPEQAFRPAASFLWQPVPSRADTPIDHM